MSARTIGIHDVAETHAAFERQLPDGSTLEYRMQVLQQPKRARACGQGAKSHADRRPVDPPPVVELRLFQGTGNEKQDVTFSHNSNFLLFATLEQARPIAQGRGMPAPPPAPVLTGVPVSGMAYLDRPSPAGYFIFPDLSVRHEGKYRLRFALFEETKEEFHPQSADPTEPREFCTHRLDVKSEAFTVFSAKKFPGLAESTALSRIVAEQGCRVRIRRDVRMRRRSDRPRGSSEEAVDATEQLRAQRAGGNTPDQYAIEAEIHAQNQNQQQNHYHPPQAAPYAMQRSNSVDRKRSGSDASVASMPDAHPQRFDGYHTPVPSHGPYGPPAGPPPQAYNSSSGQHLAFGGSQHGSGPLAPPQPQIHPPQVQPDMYQQNRQMQQAPPPRPQHQYAPTNGGPYHGSRENSMSMPGQQGPVNGQQPTRRNSVEDFRVRRDSTANYAAPPQQQQQYRPPTPQYNGQAPAQNGYAHPQYAQAPPQSTYHAQPAPPQQQVAPPPPLANSLPPIRGMLPAMEPKWNTQPTTTNGTPPSAAAPQQTASPAAYVPTNGAAPHQPQQPRRAPPATVASVPAPIPNSAQFPAFYPDAKHRGPGYPGPPPQTQTAEPLKKRPWGKVFNQDHAEGRMTGGMRPSNNSKSYGEDANYASDVNDDDDDSYDLGKLKMSYRRADGVEIVRKLPGYN